MRKAFDQTFEVKEPDSLLPFLRKKLEGRPAGKVKSILEHGLVSVDGHVVTRYDFSLRPGMTVTVSSYRPEAPAGTVEDHPEILYEDRDLLVINKPAGLLTISTGGEEPEDTAYRRMTAYVRRKKSSEPDFYRPPFRSGYVRDRAFCQEP